MSERNDLPRELGWDDEISNESGGYILLEDGDHDFTVTGFERGRFPGSAKIPPCAKAVLTLEVDAPAGAVKVKYDLILWTTLQWKIAEFCRSIGQAAPGDATVKPRWNEMVGSCGRARFKVRTYTKKDGSEGKVNDVERFYDYDAAAAQAAGAPPTWSALPGSTPTPWTGGRG